jgi:U4/U6 small nuclear ribonucleoprotein PRP31
MEDDPDYQLVLASNDILQEIDEEIASTTKFVSDLYRLKFPELETLIPNRLDFIKVIERIGNEMDLTTISLNDLLSSQLVMIVSVSSSTTSGKPLSEKQLSEVLVGCREIIKLYKEKQFLLSFIESKMNKIAPNLCNLIGSQLTAQLIGLAGGLINLSKIPSCNLQVIGQTKPTNLMGLSLASHQPHTGILFQSDLIVPLPAAFRKKALKMLSGKVALAARIDAYQFDKSVSLDQDDGGGSDSEEEEEEEEEGEKESTMKGDDDDDDESENDGNNHHSNVL